MWAPRPFFNANIRTAVPSSVLLQLFCPFQPHGPYFWVKLWVSICEQLWDLTNFSGRSLPPDQDWQEVFVKVKDVSRNATWMAIFSAYPSEELTKSAFLGFYDLLCNIPKFGLSFEILKDIPKHPEHIPCFQDSQSWLIMVSCMQGECLQRAGLTLQSNFKWDTSLLHWESLIWLLGHRLWLCNQRVFSLQNTCIFQIPCLDKAWWRRSCSGIPWFLLAHCVCC